MADLPSSLRDCHAERRDLGARRDAEQHHLGQPRLSGHSPHLSVFPVGAGIGQGLSLGLGAAVAANGRKTVVMTGDGGFFLNVGELWTAVQEKLDMTVIVMNDRGYGVIKRIQDATAQGRRFFADLQGPDLRQLARLAGIPFWKVRAAPMRSARPSARRLHIRGSAWSRST